MSWVAVGVSGGTAIINGLGKFFSGKKMAKQQKKALKNLKEDTYISPALLQALGGAEKRSNATMYAGQDIDQANLDRNANNAFSNVSRATTSSPNLVNAAMAIQGQKNVAQQWIQRNLAVFKDSANKDFTNLLLQKANAQLGNHRQYQAAKSALQGAAMQNNAQANNALWNAGAQVGGAAAGAGLNKMLGGGETGDPYSFYTDDQFPNIRRNMYGGFPTSN
jgi:hypothetical protein